MKPRIDADDNIEWWLANNYGPHVNEKAWEWILELRAEIARLTPHQAQEPVGHICIKCGWTGTENECLDYKHPVGARLCPECHENTEAYRVVDTFGCECGTCQAIRRIQRADSTG